MAKLKFDMKKTVKTGTRLLINVIVGGLILMLASNLLDSITTSAGAIISGIVTLLILLVVIPQIFAIRKGPELITDLILAIPAGLVMVSLVQEIFKVSFEIPALTTGDAGIFSLTMAMAVGSYFLADLIRVRVLGNK